MKSVCSGCNAHLSGNPNDPVVSHGMCTRECFAFYGELKEFKAELLSPDPLVAAFAVRLPSESRPGVSYEVALLVDYRETTDRYGEVIDAPNGNLSWSCECESFCLGARTCKHLAKAIHLRTLQARMTTARARRAS